MESKSSEPVFRHFDLKLAEPHFRSSLTDLIIELDYLRKKSFKGSTIPPIFFQLKSLFHILESIGSARIEGNRTTLAEYIETKLEQKSPPDDAIREIWNLEKAMAFIDETVKDYPINRAFLSELHKKVVDGLAPPPTGEGDRTPGLYRTTHVRIRGSLHLPPDPTLMQGYMDELLKFIGQGNAPKYDLLRVAIAHHRFVWVHPFTNGNGRTVRLFTYAMLVKLGFQVDVGRILNPTAVFCCNRNDYNRHLSAADRGTDEGVLEWCEYVLGGLKAEIEKIDHLLDYEYLSREILVPAIMFSLERQTITGTEAKILRRTVEKQVVQASDLKDVLTGKRPSEISRNIGRLRGKKMLMPLSEGQRKYIMRFDNNFLLRGIVKALGEKGFLAVRDEEK